MRGYIKTHFNSSTAHKVEDFFENLGLPVPQETPQGNEYTQASEGGLITFLNDSACIIRLAPHSAGVSQEHPHILKPLYQRDCGKLRAELYPGVISPVNYYDLLRLERALDRDDIRLWDNHEDNCGYLPHYTLPQFRKGIPVVIDVDACEKIKAGVRWARALLRKMTYEQKKPLPAATAWPAAANQSDPAALARAWDMCADMKQQGLLIANWQTDRIENDYKNAVTGSTLYAARCHAYRARTATPAPYPAPEIAQHAQL